METQRFSRLRQDGVYYALASCKLVRFVTNVCVDKVKLIWHQLLY